MVNLLELPLVRLVTPSDLDRYKAMSLVDANAFDRPEFDARFRARRSSITTRSPVFSVACHSRRRPHFTSVGSRAPSTPVPRRRADARRGRQDAPLSPRSPTASAATPTISSRRRRRISRRSPTSRRTSIAIFLSMLSRYAISIRAIRSPWRPCRSRGTRAFVTGPVRPQDCDAIGQAADFVRREGIRTVITHGLVDGFIDGFPAPHH